MSRPSHVLVAMAVVVVVTLCLQLAVGNPDAKRLYDDILRKHNYNKRMRPVADHNNNLTVRMNIKLSQLIDVDEKNEIITTNVWVLQEWTDCSLTWNPDHYGGVEMLYVPSEDIWRPDIVLYNNADGDYIVTMLTKATIKHTGVVEWEPPAIYKSQCNVDVEYFPFDVQTCFMKFGIWTYHGYLVDMRHMKSNIEDPEGTIIDPGMDLTSYYSSVEWDLIDVTAKKTIYTYPCCPEPYPDVTFTFTIRRKILYYTINLIIPCVSINILTLLVFYVPADCGEKISICISIMLSLSLFQLLLMELVPSTSIVTPLIGKYLLFTCILVSISIITSVFVLNLTQRSAATHTMPRLVRRLLVDTLPTYLCMRRPGEAQRANVDFSQAHSELLPFDNPYKSTTRSKLDSTMAVAAAAAASSRETTLDGGGVCQACARYRLRKYPPNVHKALDSIAFIANHLASADDSRRVKDDWKFLSKVVDRILLYVYITVCLVGGAGVLMSAPSLYDTRQALDAGK